MSNDELLAKLNGRVPMGVGNDDDVISYTQDPFTNALRAVVELCASQDKATIGDKGIFNSGRNSIREEIKQAIEKELG